MLTGFCVFLILGIAFLLGFMYLCNNAPVINEDNEHKEKCSNGDEIKIKGIDKKGLKSITLNYKNGETKNISTKDALIGYIDSMNKDEFTMNVEVLCKGEERYILASRLLNICVALLEAEN